MRALPVVIVAVAVLVASVGTWFVVRNRDAHLARQRDEAASSAASSVLDRLSQRRMALISAAESLGPSQILRTVIATDAATVQDQIDREGLQNLRKHEVFAIGRRVGAQEASPLELLAAHALPNVSTDALRASPAIAAALASSATDASAGTLSDGNRVLFFAVAPVLSFDRNTHGFVLVGDLLDQSFISAVADQVHGTVVLSDGKNAISGVGAGAFQQKLGAIVGAEPKYKDRTYTDAAWQIAARAVPIDSHMFLWVGANMSAETQSIQSFATFAITIIWVTLLGGSLIVALVLWRRSRAAPVAPTPLDIWAGTSSGAGTLPNTQSSPASTTGASALSRAATRVGMTPPSTTPPSVTDLLGWNEPKNMFGRYKLLERLGSGGMAEVWTAVVTGAQGFRRPVVVKRIRRDLASNPSLIQPFIDEANLAAQLVHSNIVPVFDFGDLDGEYFLAQEYILGRDVGKITLALAERGQRLDPALALYICAETLKALDYAHTLTDRSGRPLGIVHRDISPSNILCSSRGEVKLIDFGIAKSVSKVGQTETGTVKGNLRFMSPEQAQGQVVDGRSDLFSLAMSVYFTQSGSSLYRGTTQYDLLLAAAKGPDEAGQHQLNGLPSPLRELLFPAFATDLSQRYASAQQFLDAIQQCVPVDGARRLASLISDLFGNELRQQETQFATALDGTDAIGADEATVQSLPTRLKQGLP